MCGIVGFVTHEPTGREDELLARMSNVIEHRGPDGHGRFAEPPAWLGHLRLSIIDLAAGGQPMGNEDGSLQVVYNGEIFNHASLRAELLQHGHVYQTRCDTESILHAYEQYGEACVERFRGMFAFVIWDRTRKQLFCARDRLGIKPFYYFSNGRLFAFASEIKALLEHPEIRCGFDDTLLPEYMAFGYTSGEKTFFPGIRKLMPGHTMRVNFSGASALQPKLRRYWDVPAPVEQDDRPEHEWISECRSRLEETVRMRLMSDVPLGMFLSGGVDSSAITALVKRMAPGPVLTFAVGYAEEQYSELSYARQVAERLGTDHHEVTLCRDDFFGSLPSLIWQEDEPIVWPSSVSLYHVAQLARKHVKVVLTGEGSDELFGGYARYHTYQWNQRWLPYYRLAPSPIRSSLSGFVENSTLLSASLRRKLGHTFLVRGDRFESLYLDNFYSAFSHREQAPLLRHAPAIEQIYGNYQTHWENRAGASTLSRLLYADQKTYLVELLMKQDQMSMACSIESRVPFLDHPFVEFASRVPDSLRIRNGEGKYILKRAVEDLLPRDIIYRRKMGFPTPLRDWLRGSQAAPLLGSLTEPSGFLSGYLDLHQVKRLTDRHQSRVEDCTDRLWRLLNLQIWGDVFQNGKRAKPAPVSGCFT